MSLPDKVRYWLVSANKSVAAEISTKNHDRRAWVKVTAARPIPEDPMYNLPEDVRFGVRYFEVEKNVLQEAKDNDRYIENEEVLNEEVIIVNNETELEQVLSRWLANLDKLVLPYFCDYPT